MKKRMRQFLKSFQFTYFYIHTLVKLFKLDQLICINSQFENYHIYLSTHIKYKRTCTTTYFCSEQSETRIRMLLSSIQSYLPPFLIAMKWIANIFFRAKRMVTAWFPFFVLMTIAWRLCCFDSLDLDSFVSPPMYEQRRFLAEATCNTIFGALSIFKRLKDLLNGSSVL
jgi:hypothetical protein